MFCSTAHTINNVLGTVLRVLENLTESLQPSQEGYYNDPHITYEGI